MAENVADQRPHVPRVGGDVVEAVGGEAGIAEAAQVGDDHLEARRGQGRDVAPPDPLGLGPAVDQQQRVATDSRAHVGELDPTHLGALECEGVGGRWLAHPATV